MLTSKVNYSIHFIHIQTGVSPKAQKTHNTAESRGFRLLECYEHASITRVQSSDVPAFLLPFFLEDDGMASYALGSESSSRRCTAAAAAAAAPRLGRACACAPSPSLLWDAAGRRAWWLCACERSSHASESESDESSSDDSSNRFGLW